MRPLVRPAPVAVLCFAFAALGCGSNNKGKIEGKWKAVTFEGQENDMKEMETVGAYLYFDFQPDGSLTLGLDSTNKEFKALMEKMGQKVSWTCKYRLLSGDDVEMYDLPKEMQSGKSGGLFGGKDKARSKITITGDEMTLKDPDGKTGHMTRMK
jgi:hypothetical protein